MKKEELFKIKREACEDAITAFGMNFIKDARDYGEKITRDENGNLKFHCDMNGISIDYYVCEHHTEDGLYDVYNGLEVCYRDYINIKIMKKTAFDLLKENRIFLKLKSNINFDL